MFRTTNDARFWDRAARKYAADPIADMGGYERTLERTQHYLKGEEAAFEFGCGQVRRRSSSRPLSDESWRPTSPAK